MKIFKTSIRFYNNKPVRACFDYDNNVWLYSAVDLIDAIVDTTSPRRYWSDLKRRNGQLFANCVQYKLTAKDLISLMAKEIADTISELGIPVLLVNPEDTDLLNEIQLNSLLVKIAKADNKNLTVWLKGLNNPLDEKSKRKAYELYDNGLLNLTYGRNGNEQTTCIYKEKGIYIDDFSNTNDELDSSDVDTE